LRDKVRAFLLVFLMGVTFIIWDVYNYFSKVSPRTVFPFFIFIGLPLIFISIGIYCGYKEEK